MRINILIPPVTTCIEYYPIIAQTDGYRYIKEKCINIFSTLFSTLIDIVKHPRRYARKYIIDRASYSLSMKIVVFFVKFSVVLLKLHRVACVGFLLGLIFHKKMREVVNKINSLAYGILSEPYYIKLPKYGVLLGAFIGASIVAIPMSLVIFTLYVFGELGMNCREFVNKRIREQRAIVIQNNT
jgi:hypothetical protein